MKIYPKVNANLSRPPTQRMFDNMGSAHGSLPELVALARSFYKEAYPKLFEMIVKQVWLEQKFTYAGVRRGARSGNGYGADWAFSFFMHNMVGMSQKPLTTGIYFIAIPTYFKDFFPNFSDHNPFEDPEYFKFPYKHVTIDFLAFVYQYHERIELLQYAEEKKMSIRDFIDFAYNQAMCYNDEQKADVYEINRHSFIPLLKRRIN